MTFFVAFLGSPTDSPSLCLKGVWLLSCEWGFQCTVICEIEALSLPCLPRWWQSTRTNQLWSTRLQERWGLSGDSKEITRTVVKTHRFFHDHLIPGLEFQGAAGAMPCCGSLGAGTGVGRGRRGGLVHGERASSGGSVAGSGYGRRRGRTHQLQPPTEIPAALCRCVWCAGIGVWDQDERR